MPTFLYNSFLSFCFLDWYFKSIFILSCPITQPQKSRCCDTVVVSLSCFSCSTLPHPLPPVFSLNAISVLAHVAGTKGLLTLLMYINPCKTLCCFTNKTKQKKIKDDPCIKHILSQYFGSQCSVLAKLLLLLLWNLLLPQQPWINFRPSGISIWVIHGNVWALNLGWHSFLYFQLYPDWSLEIVKKWETDHPELNFILSFPVLSLPGFILKGRDLYSLLHFKEQWMKCSFIADFLNVWKTLIFCIFSMH